MSRYDTKVEDCYPVCRRCKKPVLPEHKVWLELEDHTGNYYVPGTVEMDNSIGCFPFGRTCAEKVMKEQLVRSLKKFQAAKEEYERKE